MAQPDGEPVRRASPAGRWKIERRKLVQRLSAGLASGFTRLVCRTLRIQRVEEAKYLGVEGGCILCVWHGRTLPQIAHFRGQDVSIMISLSRDGEFMAKVLDDLGYPALRGSTGPSGARVLASAIKRLRAGRTVAVTPDGPRGPSGVVQAGAVAMARRSGASLVPIGGAARPCFFFRSWDRYLVPLPFARATLVFGDPVAVPEDADDAAQEEIRIRLQKEMRRVQDEADRRMGVPTFGELSSRRPLRD